MDVISALREHSEAGATIVDLIYGDMGFEVSKSIEEFGKAKQRTPAEQAKHERRLKAVAATSNVVGAGAGIATAPAVYREARDKIREARGTKPKPLSARPKVVRRVSGALKATPGRRKVLRAIGNKKLGAALAVGSAGLAAGNLGGDVLSAKLLGAESKKPVKKDYTDVGIYTEISKVDEDKRQIFGWASVTSINGEPVIDLQGDVLPLEEIEKAAYEFVNKSRIGGNMHQKHETGPIHVSDMIESMVLTPEKKEAMGLPDTVPEGWWVGFKVNDDKTWQEAKDGKLAGLSIHGTGKRAPVSA